MARIAIIPGDGIGQEVVPEAVKVLETIALRDGLELDFDDWPHGADHYLETGCSITDDEMRRLGGYDAVLLGALGDPRVPDNAHARDILLGMRFRLDLYVNLRPVRLLSPRLTPLRDVRPSDVDITIFRENTEGSYVGVGGVFKRGTPDEIALEEDVNTRTGVERIIRAAFEYARARARRRVTMVDKANALRHAGDLWRRAFAEIGAEYEEIEREALYVDLVAHDLVRRPERFDVIVTGNLFGDILSDLAAALVGGLGLAPSANLRPGGPGVFEPVHGSAPDIAGTGRANPLAAILSAAMLLEHLGHARAAGDVVDAVRDALVEGPLTQDLGGEASTAEIGDRVRDVIQKTPARIRNTE
ncbi:MAG: 3-isopropylmalate dehydrogenase [Longimicrobiales bacterium]